jgi:hypothetical protein
MATQLMLPSAEAIDIMNQNAAAAAARARWAGMAQAQRRVGRDALRRDHVVRTPTAEFLANHPIPEVKPVPPDETPKGTDPNEEIKNLIRNLVSQFQGTGGSGGGGGGGGGGTTYGSGGSGTGTGGSVYGFSNPNGVQTFYGDPGATYIGPSGGQYEWKNTGWRYPGSQPMGASLSSPDWKIQNGTWWQRVRK